ncbi:MAG: hypothetical protein K2H47_10940 [Muribaculaceae bacterium]|nr:hypothetical protein [Muribaculaceae bacterium]
MNHKSLVPKPEPVTMIYSCNCTPELAEKFHYPNDWDNLEAEIGHVFKHTVSRVVAYNTYQFNNYDNYDVQMFREEDKRAWCDEHFTDDQCKDFDTAKKIVHEYT